MNRRAGHLRCAALLKQISPGRSSCPTPASLLELARQHPHPLYMTFHGGVRLGADSAVRPATIVLRARCILAGGTRLEGKQTMWKRQLPLALLAGLAVFPAEAAAQLG
jgi:hypothetical protein